MSKQAQEVGKVVSMRGAVEVINKLPRTTTKEYYRAMRSYLAFCTEVDEKEDATEEERVSYMVKRFRDEYGWMIERAGVERAAVEWMQGLAIGVDYMNHAIPSAVLKLHGYDPNRVRMSERLEEVVINGWWLHLGQALARIIRKEGK